MKELPEGNLQANGCPSVGKSKKSSVSPLLQKGNNKKEENPPTEMLKELKVCQLGYNGPGSTLDHPVFCL